MNDRILILDFGSQLTQLIARRVRESGVYCEIHKYNISEKKILDFDPKAIILSGGPSSVTNLNTPKARNIVFQMDVPVLGICYGQQTMCSQLGGKGIWQGIFKSEVKLQSLPWHLEGRKFSECLDESWRSCGENSERLHFGWS